MFPKIISDKIPGKKSREYAKRLSQVESANVTYLSDDFPVFWAKAKGCNIWDSDGNRFLDLTSAFGVASLGHTNAAVEEAIREQAGKLIHGMGDVHPPESKVLFLEKLISLLPPGLDRAILSCNGSDACESALKTAQRYTKKPGLIAFRNSYHGLGYGALDLTGIDFFRAGFERRLSAQTFFAEFPNTHEMGKAALEKSLYSIEKILEQNKETIGSLILEPIQARGGVVVPPDGFLVELKNLCRKNNLLLILDEIYTGFARTGKLFAFEWDGVLPDLICLGKTLSGGLPLSACVGSQRIIEKAWPKSTGAAIHTSTFLGNPLACIAGLATLRELEKFDLSTIEKKSNFFREKLIELKKLFPKEIVEVRGRGLMMGVEFKEQILLEKIILAALKKGLILLSSGTQGKVLSFSPPLVISEEELSFTVKTITDLLKLEKEKL